MKLLNCTDTILVGDNGSVILKFLSSVKQRKLYKCDSQEKINLTD